MFSSKKIDRRFTGSCKWDDAKDAGSYEGFVPLTVADMEFSAPEPVIAALQNAAAHGVIGYTMADDAYKNAVLSFQKRRHGIEYTEDDLFCTSGVVHALGIAVREFTAPNDYVIVQPPVYGPFFDAVELNGRNIAANPLILRNGRYEMDFEGLKAQIRRFKPKLMLLCSPHNPVGRVWTKLELTELLSILRENSITAVADEIHCDIVYGKNSFVPFQSIDGAREISISCTAMSKTFNLAGLSCSNIFIRNQSLREGFAKRLFAEGCHCIPYFARAAAIAAFTECDYWIDALCEYVFENLRLCQSILKNKAPRAVMHMPEGTYLAWIDLSAYEFDVYERTKTLRALNHIAVTPGGVFGDEGKRCIRVNVALPRDELMRALNAISF